MPTIRRMFNQALFVILTLTVLLLLVAIVVLPGRGSTYTDLAETESEPASDQPDAIVHNTWSSGSNMPTALWAPAGVGVLGGLIYVVGGCTNSGVIADTQIYNPTTNTWSTGVSLPVTGCDGVAAVVKGIL